MRPTPTVAVRSQALACGGLIAGIVGLNPAQGMPRILCLLWVGQVTASATSWSLVQGVLPGAFVSNFAWSRNFGTRLPRPKLGYCATKKEKKRNTLCKGYHCTVCLFSFERHTKHCAQVNRNNEKQTKKAEKQFFASVLRCFGCKTLSPLLPQSQERMTQVRQLSSLLPYSKCNPVYSENSTGPSVVGEFKRGQCQQTAALLLCW